MILLSFDFMSLTTYPQLHELATTLATHGLVKAVNKYCGDRRPLSDTLLPLRSPAARTVLAAPSGPSG